jgi:hypothetical protein
MAEPDDLVIMAWRTAYGQSFTFVENAIRADEREQCDPGFIGTAMKLMAEDRERLLAQVEALTTRGIGARVVDGQLETYALVERDEVLALFEGESDD